MFSIKIHKSYRNVVAICDSELIGKKFEEGKFQLDIRENFYKDKEISEQELISLMKMQAKEDSTFNIVGKNSTNVALEAGLIEENMIGEIAEIPYTLTLL